MPSPSQPLIPTYNSFLISISFFGLFQLPMYGMIELPMIEA
jgi:hypothetical protein